MTDQPSDLSLLTAFIAGDQEALAMLIARHHILVRGSCTRQASPGEIDDCVQAVFVVLTHRPAAALRSGNLPGWLVRVAGFVTRNSRRKSSRRQQAEQAAAQAHPDISKPENEGLSHLDECLQRLPERQRTAITLHYFAGHSADDLARVLGVSRENAYQLISRGIAGLRTLLARRGVSVSAVALAALLAGQAQAAEVGMSTTLIVNLCTMPSPPVFTLAQGAMTTMTITTISSIALAAGLVCATGLTAVLLTAEQDFVTQPVNHVTENTVQRSVVERSSPSERIKGVAIRAKQLDQEISANFEDTNIVDVVSFIEKSTGVHVVLDPQSSAGVRQFTVNVVQMKLRDFLDLVMNLTGLTYTLRDEGVYLSKAPTPTDDTSTAIGFHEENISDQLKNVVEQRVTFNFEKTPTAETWAFFSQITGLNIEVDPQVTASADTVTLQVRDMRFVDVMKRISKMKSLSITARNGGLRVVPSQPSKSTTEF